jgi:hypothetical protein
MSFNLGEMSRWCIQWPPATLFFKPLSLRWRASRKAQAKDLPAGKEHTEQGGKVTSAGGFLELSSLLASNLSLP